MADPCLPLEDLIAHHPPMRLLDRVITVTDTEAVAEANVDPDCPLFVQGRGLPAYAGIEMMAQAIAAVDGYRRKSDGLPPKIGFLLGCRRYSVRCADFPGYARLRITANMVFSDGAMFSFECRIEDEEGTMLANASMNVFAPTNPRAFLEDALA